MKEKEINKDNEKITTSQRQGCNAPPRQSGRQDQACDYLKVALKLYQRCLKVVSILPQVVPTGAQVLRPREDKLGDKTKHAIISLRLHPIHLPQQPPSPKVYGITTCTKSKSEIFTGTKPGTSGI